MSDFSSNNRNYEYNYRRHSTTPAWIVGGVLILVGVIILFQNLTGFHFVNWWALFILIPAFAALNRAYQSYRYDGRLSRQARSNLLGGVILTLLAGAFLLNVNFSLLWPLALIIGGMALLLNGTLPD